MLIKYLIFFAICGRQCSIIILAAGKNCKEEFDGNVIAELHKRARYFQKKYGDASQVQLQQVQHEFSHGCDLLFDECNIRFRLVDEEQVDDLTEFYTRAAGNEINGIVGKYRRGRNLHVRSMKHLVQFHYNRTGNEIQFFEDPIVGVSNLTFSIPRQFLDVQIPEDADFNKDLAMLVNDLITFRKKAFNFLENLDINLKNVYYYHYTTNIDSNIHFIFQDHEIREKTIFKSNGIIKGEYLCDNLKQEYEISENRLAVIGEPFVVLLGANSIPSKSRSNYELVNITETIYTDY